MDSTTTTTTPGVTYVSLPQSSIPSPIRKPRSPFAVTTGVPAIDCLSFEDLKARRDLQFDGHLRRAYQQRFNALAAQEAEERTAAILRLREKRKLARKQRRIEQRGIVTESATMGEMCDGPAECTSTLENVTEHSGEMPNVVSAGTPQTDTHEGAKTQHDLNDFFERPVNIYDATWNSGTEYDVSLDVWNLWSLDQSVRAKLSNYSYFRGNLKVKISVSGTPFHYGRVSASYQPYAIYNDTLTAYDRLLGSATPGPTDAIRECYKNYLSQAPGFDTIDVSSNQPLVVDIPFISHKQMFKLYNNTATVITNSVSFEDFAEAGELRLGTLNPFLVANDDYDTHVSLNVYAWVENIELGCTTATNVDITAESKTVSEYNSSGPISTAATAVASASSLLADVPVIGAYAKAMSTIAGGVGAVAAWFGFSKPVVLDKPVYVKNQPFANGANLSASDTALRIVCDPKQELTIDQTLGGVTGPDDMAITTIASRPTFLTTFGWETAQVAMTVPIWSTMVAPTQVSYGGLSNGMANLVQPTTTDFASRPFSYWRGTMKYRFEIVCSKFHRGKLLIKYEPNCAQATLISSNPSKLNQQNSVIIDIQDTQDVTLAVDWAFPRAWADVDPRLDDLVPFSDVAYASCSTGNIALRAAYANGFIQVTPLNELVQPTATAQVRVNVYVSCDDLQLAYPTARGIVGGDEALIRRYNYTESKDITTVETINPNDSTLEGIHDYHFGEKVVSFRSLLKRYTQITSYAGDTGTNGAVTWSIRGNSIPWLASAVARGNAASEPGTPGNYTNNLYNYLRPAYMAMRGGWRYRVIPASSGEVTASNYTRVTMSAPSSVGFDNYNVGLASSMSNSAIISSSARLEGTVNYHLTSNGGVEFEIPFYCPSLFVFTQASYGAGISADPELGYYDITNAFWTARFSIDHGNPSAHATKGDAAFSVDAIPAEDFTFLRFQGAPFLTISP